MMKRFYKLVTVAETAGGYAIHLDGKPVKTPSRKGLVAPNRMIADALATEWASQKDTINPDMMPLTQIVTTTQEHVPQARAEMEPLILAYLNTDLLCYRTEIPEAMAERHALLWDPWLQWFHKNYGAALQTTTALRALHQPQPAHDAVAQKVRALDLWRFSVLQIATAISGSIVLGLAFVDKAISVDQIFAAIHVEEDYRAEIYNEKLYGPDPAQEKAMASKLRDFHALRLVLDSL